MATPAQFSAAVQQLKAVLDEQNLQGVVLFSSTQFLTGFSARTIQCWLYGASFGRVQIIYDGTTFHYVVLAQKIVQTIRKIHGSAIPCSFFIVGAGQYDSVESATNALVTKMIESGKTRLAVTRRDIDAFEHAPVPSIIDGREAPHMSAHRLLQALRMRGIQLIDSSAQLSRIPRICADPDTVTRVGQVAMTELQCARQCVVELQEGGTVQPLTELSQSSLNQTLQTLKNQRDANENNLDIVSSTAPPLLTQSYSGQAARELPAILGPLMLSQPSRMSQFNSGVVNVVTRPVYANQQAVCGRTFFFMVPSELGSLYTRTFDAHQQAQQFIVEGANVSDISANVRHSHRDRLAEYASFVGPVLGWVIPRSLDEDLLPIVSATDYRLREDDVVCIWTALNHVSMPAWCDESGVPIPFSIVLADTYIINGGSAKQVTVFGRHFDFVDVHYAQKDKMTRENQRNTRYQEAAARDITRAQEGTQVGRHVLRNRDSRSTQDKERARIVQARERLVATANRMTTEAITSGTLATILGNRTEQAPVAFERLDEVDQLPEEDLPTPGLITACRSHHSLWLPIDDVRHVPIRSSFISKVSVVPNSDGDQADFIIDFVAFNRNGTIGGHKAELAQFMRFPDSVFCRQLKYRCPLAEAKRAEAAYKVIRQLSDQSSMSTAVLPPAPAPQLQLLARPVVLKPDVVLKPSPERGAGVRARLQLHTNGLRFPFRGADHVDIQFDNISMVVLQEASTSSAAALLHIHLRNPQIVQTSRGTQDRSIQDFQFVHEIISQEQLDDEHRQRLDTELQQEASERERIALVNQEFNNFVEQLSETAQAAGTALNIDILRHTVRRIDDDRLPTRERNLTLEYYQSTHCFAAEGIVGRTKQTIYFSPRGVYALRHDVSPQAWLCLPSNEILISCISRLDSSTERDISFVVRNTWQIVEISAMNAVCSTNFAGWAALTARIAVFQSAKAVNWDSMLDLVKNNWMDVGGDWRVFFGEIAPPGDESSSSSAEEESSEFQPSSEEAFSDDEEFEHRTESFSDEDEEEVDEYEYEGEDSEEADKRAAEEDARLEERRMRRNAMAANQRRQRAGFR